MSTAASRKFLYCGKINYINGKSDESFHVDFELETPLPEYIAEEFTKLSL